MDSIPSEALRPIEVLSSIEPFVKEQLGLLLPTDKAWQPTDYLPDFTGETWIEEVKDMRERAAMLSDEALVVLVANMVTEEALPTYSAALNLIARDTSGVSDAPWAVWSRGWTSEENRHGDLLSAYLRLTGRVDMRGVELTVHNLLANGFAHRTDNDIYGGLVYTSFQERATRVSHTNVGRLAANCGDKRLAKICAKIAGDEARHEAFYTRMMGKVLDLDTEAGMVTIGSILRRGIAMPGKLMDDGQDPDLFEHFATVAQRIGVYTARDYAAIVEHLVDTWQIAARRVTGKAARMQDLVCSLAQKVNAKADRMLELVKEQPAIPFSWIHNRKV